MWSLYHRHIQLKPKNKTKTSFWSRKLLFLKYIVNLQNKRKPNLYLSEVKLSDEKLKNYGFIELYQICWISSPFPIILVCLQINDAFFPNSTFIMSHLCSLRLPFTLVIYPPPSPDLLDHRADLTFSWPEYVLSESQPPCSFSHTWLCSPNYVSLFSCIKLSSFLFNFKCRAPLKYIHIESISSSHFFLLFMQPNFIFLFPRLVW